MGLVLLAQSALMTFPKLSCGGRVCKAGSRGQGEMLQQIYSLLGDRGVVGEDGGERRRCWGELGWTCFPK